MLVYQRVLGSFKVHTQLTCLPAIEHSASYKRRAFLRLLVEAVHVPHIMATEENCHEKGMFHIVSMSTGVRILSMSASCQFVYPNLFHMCFHVDRIPHFVHVSIIHHSTNLFHMCFHVHRIPYFVHVSIIPIRISQSVAHVFPCWQDSAFCPCQHHSSFHQYVPHVFPCPQDSVFCPCQHHSNSYIPICCTCVSMLTGFRILSMSASCQFVYPNLFHMCFHVDRSPHFVHVSIVPIHISQSVPHVFPCWQDSAFCPCQHHANSYIPICSTCVSVSTRFRILSMSASFQFVYPNLLHMCFHVDRISHFVHVSISPIRISQSVAQSFHVNISMWTWFHMFSVSTPFQLVYPNLFPICSHVKRIPCVSMSFQLVYPNLLHNLSMSTWLHMFCMSTRPFHICICDIQIVDG